ncbi:MAG: TetR/AcrR family transcriptional regulator [Chloroflexota bacterium]|nr:TetR/AcrR family transcriptional regulator [Chloroflexota bacterium]
MAKSFGKPGRPREDHDARRDEIYDAVRPVVTRRGAGASVEELAAAAGISVGGLYHYFSNKRELMLYPLLSDGPANRRCHAFKLRWEPVRHAEPRAYLNAFADFSVAQIMWVRPAVMAALGMGADVFTQAAESGLRANFDDFVDALSRISGPLSTTSLQSLAMALRRAYLGAALDPQVNELELRRTLGAIVGPYAARRVREGEASLSA